MSKTITFINSWWSENIRLQPEDSSVCVSFFRYTSLKEVFRRLQEEKSTCKNIQKRKTVLLGRKLFRTHT